MKKWNDLKTAILKFSTEDQITKGELCSALTVKRLPGEQESFAILDGDHRSHLLSSGSKIFLEIDGENKGAVFPVVDDETIEEGMPVYRRMHFVEA